MGRSANLERARLLAVGALGGGIVHEFANLLTVVDGLRQMGEMGMTKAWRPELLRKPALRCDELVSAFRSTFADEVPQSVHALGDSLRWIETLLAARLRGHRATVELASVPAIELSGSLAPSVRVALLCCLLAMIEQIGVEPDEPDRLRIHAERAEGGALLLRLDGPRWPDVETRSPATAALFEAASDLAAEVGGRLATDADSEGARVELSFPG